MYPLDYRKTLILLQARLPHNYYYYWRELYVPQPTGPSSFAFMPAGDELTYSTDSSLWRQRIDSGEAFEITHAIAAGSLTPTALRVSQRMLQGASCTPLCMRWHRGMSARREGLWIDRNGHGRRHAVA
ncbi:MAG: hypothetical protein ACREVI_03150 [Steroidobacteraceae bacterium]